MRAVVDEEGLVGIAIAEVSPQERQNAVLRFDFRAENAALSATMVRELCRYGDIRRAAAYVPAPVFAALEACGK